MTSTLHFEVLTGSFAVDVDPPAEASVYNRACVFGDVFPPEGLRGQQIVIIRLWCFYIHRWLANAGSRRIFLGPSWWSCNTNYCYYYYNYYLTWIYYIVISYYVMLCYVVLCCVVLCYIILYYIILYYINIYPISLSSDAAPVILTDRHIWWQEQYEATFCKEIRQFNSKSRNTVKVKSLKQDYGLKRGWGILWTRKKEKN